METLPHCHLMTLTLEVDFARVVGIGATPAGYRGIVPVSGGWFEGSRVSGTVAPGNDWFVTREDGVLLIDVRLVLKTDDAATIYLAYQGRMTGKGDALARFREGALLDAGEYALTVVARFECGDARYAWLNDAIVVGTGVQTRTGPIYHMFEVGG